LIRNVLKHGDRKFEVEEEVLKGQNCLKKRGSEIGNLGTNVEGLEVFENTGIGS